MTQIPEQAPLTAIWKRHRTLITRTIAIVLFLFAWEASVRWGGVSPLFLSSPSAVVLRMIKVFSDGSIWPNIIATANIAAWGAFLAVAVGVPIGVVMGRSLLIRDTLEPFIMAVAAAPIVAFLPLLIIWLGIGPASKIALVFVGALFVIIINTEAGVRQIDRRLIETARSFTATEFEILVKIVGPAALPFIVAGLRLAIARVLDHGRRGGVLRRDRRFGLHDLSSRIAVRYDARVRRRGALGRHGRDLERLAAGGRTPDRSLDAHGGCAMIEVRNVTHAFNQGEGKASHPVLNNVSLTVETGKFVSLLGPSGCGKTTLLRIIDGLVRPTSGVVLNDGDRRAEAG